MPLGATADAVARPALGTPVIKGSIFARVVGEAAALLAAGEVSLAELGRWLRPEDCALLAEAPISSGWYPLDAYTRLNDLIRDVAGGGSNAYLRERGKETARQLLESGRYPQLEYSRRTELARTADPRERFAARSAATCASSRASPRTW